MPLVDRRARVLQFLEVDDDLIETDTSKIPHDSPPVQLRGSDTGEGIHKNQPGRKRYSLSGLPISARWPWSLGQVACAEKSNEITAIPELLRLVDIHGAIITIDAMGTQKAIAEQIIAGGGDYVLALKGNQEALHQAVIAYIDEQLEGDLAAAREHVTTETGHGREEVRTYLQLPTPKDLPGFLLWKGLKSIGLTTTSIRRDGKETIEVRYYLSSLESDVKRFARAVRGHWSIENSCHWTLDMTFGEDHSRTRERHLRENLSWLNRFALSLLKQHPGRQSLVMKRRSCGWSDAFLMEVVMGSTC